MIVELETAAQPMKAYRDGVRRAPEYCCGLRTRHAVPCDESHEFAICQTQSRDAVAGAFRKIGRLSRLTEGMLVLQPREEPGSALRSPSLVAQEIRRHCVQPRPCLTGVRRDAVEEPPACEVDLSDEILRILMGRDATVGEGEQVPDRHDIDGFELERCVRLSIVLSDFSMGVAEWPWYS